MLGLKDRISSNCADELRAEISGCVAVPGDELYDESTRVWSGAVRRRPAIVAFCKQPEDVQAAVRAARRYRLPLSVRGGGHDWAGRALCKRWARHRPEAKFWLRPQVQVVYNDGFDGKTLREVLELVETNRERIETAWRKFFR